MITRDYLLEKPRGPSAAKVFLDQRVIPAAIDAAGACEVALERASQRTGLSVPVLLAGAGGLLALVAWRGWRAGAPGRR